MEAVPGDAPARSARREIFALAGFAIVCFSVSAIGGLVTAQSVQTWYPTLDKPGFTPPDWLFAPVWTALYAAMAVAGWLVWRKVGFAGGRLALGLFAVQLALNCSWSILFFGAHAIGAALVDIIALWFVILAATAVFWRIDRLAEVLFVPYLLWVGYAAALNGAIWLRN